MEDDVEKVVKSKILHFKSKADHNKNESLLIFKFIMLSTLGGPIFVAFGDGDVYGKIVPAILSLIAAALTSWVQLRKPQSLWKNYRTAQRKLEVELEKYCFKVAEYKGDDRESTLILKANEIYIETHLLWSELVPKPENIDLAAINEAHNHGK